MQIYINIVSIKGVDSIIHSKEGIDTLECDTASLFGKLMKIEPDEVQIEVHHDRRLSEYSSSLSSLRLNVQVFAPINVSTAVQTKLVRTLHRSICSAYGRTRDVQDRLYVSVVLIACPVSCVSGNALRKK